MSFDFRRARRVAARRAGGGPGRDGLCLVNGDGIGAKPEPRLTAADQGEIHFGEQAGVEQRAMKIPFRCIEWINLV